MCCFLLSELCFFVFVGFDSSLGKVRESFALKSQIIALLGKAPCGFVGDINDHPIYGPLLSLAFDSLHDHMRIVVASVQSMLAKELDEATKLSVGIAVDTSVDRASGHSILAQPGPGQFRGACC